MAYPVTFNYEVVKGDSVPVLPVSINYIGYDFTGTTGVAQVRQKAGNVLLTNLTVEIDTPALGELLVQVYLISPSTKFLPVGVHNWDLELIFPDGKRKTWVGGSFTVSNDVSVPPN